MFRKYGRINDLEGFFRAGWIVVDEPYMIFNGHKVLFQRVGDLIISHLASEGEFLELMDNIWERDGLFRFYREDERWLFRSIIQAIRRDHGVYNLYQFIFDGPYYYSWLTNAIPSCIKIKMENIVTKRKPVYAYLISEMHGCPLEPEPIDFEPRTGYTECKNEIHIAGYYLTLFPIGVLLRNDSICVSCEVIRKQDLFWDLWIKTPNMQEGQYNICVQYLTNGGTILHTFPDLYCVIKSENTQGNGNTVGPGIELKPESKEQDNSQFSQQSEPNNRTSDSSNNQSSTSYRFIDNTYRLRTSILLDFDIFTQIFNKELMDLQDSFGATVLHWAIRFGRSDIASFLIEQGANVNISTFAGETPIMLACDQKNIEIVTEILNTTKVVDKVNIFKQNAVFYCTHRDGTVDRTIVDMLVKAKFTKYYQCTFGLDYEGNYYPPRGNLNEEEDDDNPESEYESRIGSIGEISNTGVEKKQILTEFELEEAIMALSKIILDHPDPIVKQNIESDIEQFHNDVLHRLKETPNLAKSMKVIYSIIAEDVETVSLDLNKMIAEVDDVQPTMEL